MKREARILGVLVSALLCALTPGRSDAQTCFPAPGGLVGWWRGQNSAADAQGTHHGTLLNGATFTTGQVGTALDLDGSNDYVEISDSLALTPTSITVHAWIRPDAVSGSQVIVSKYDASDPDERSWILSINNGKLRFVVYEGGLSDGVESTVATVSSGVWQHVAATFDASTQSMRLYASGSELGTSSFGTTGVTQISNSETPMRIGSAVDFFGDLFDFYLGGIDELQLIGRALSQSEIQAIYDADATGQCVDSDGDGRLDPEDNCPSTANSDQADLDADSLGDVCDDDADGDATLDLVDNCPALWNADQLYRTPGGPGDACTDADGDGLSDEDELRYFGTSPDDPDTDDSGTIDPLDLPAAAWCETILSCPVNDPTGQFCSSFGEAVALSGNRLVVGFPSYDHEGSYDVGGAYIYERSGTSWTRVAGPALSGGSEFEQAGASVAISGDAAVLGGRSLPFYPSTVTILHRSGGGWAGEASVSLGYSSGAGLAPAVDIKGDLLVVGQPENSDIATNAGAAFVYRRSPAGSTWNPEGSLVPGSLAAEDRFGSAVSIVGDRIAVGAPGFDGVDTNVGRVFVFRRQLAEWAEETVVQPSDPRPGDAFGSALAGEMTHLMMGAPFSDHLGTVADTGAVDSVTRVGSIWTGSARMIRPPSVGAASLLGSAVALGARTAAVGADGSSRSFASRRTIGNPQPGSSGWVGARLNSSVVSYVGDFGLSVAADDKTIVVGGRRRSVGGGPWTGVVSIYDPRLQTDPDCDGDLLPNDNCPSVPNPDQANLDGDADGDACDDDLDNDGIENDSDKCPNDYHPSQIDTDNDGVGDYCDPCPLVPGPDLDSDGICLFVDNCPTVTNANQSNIDGDPSGDACDSDRDNDDIDDVSDNCIGIPNTGQEETDDPPDGFGDECDVDELDTSSTPQFGQSFFRPEFRFFLDPAGGWVSSGLPPVFSPITYGTCKMYVDPNTPAKAEFEFEWSAPYNSAASNRIGCCAWEVNCLDGAGARVICGTNPAVYPPPGSTEGTHTLGVKLFTRQPLGEQPVFSADGDAFPNQCDNCDHVPNNSQADADADGIGDACECGEPQPDGAVDSRDVEVLRRALTKVPSPISPPNCNAIGAVNDADSDGNGLRDDCNVVDLAMVQRAALAALQIPDVTCAAQAPPAP